MAEIIDGRIGHNLSAMRAAAGLSIESLAHRTGLQPAMLTLYEGGERRIPVEVLALLSAALGRRISDFFV